MIIARGSDVRAFTIRPWLAGTIAAVAVVFGTLYLSATAYLFFRDDILNGTVAQQAQMRQDYEDRIALLRSDIDRLTSRQLLNQEQIEADVRRLTGKQAALDARQDIIAGLSQAARRAGIVPTPASAAALRAADTSLPAAAPTAAGVKSPLADAAIRTGSPTMAPDPAKRIGAVANSLTSLARQQVAYVDNVSTRVARRSQKIVAVLTRLGQTLPPGYAANNDNVGGPLVALPPDADTATFRQSVSLVTGEIEQFGALRRIALRLPLTAPIAGAPITSPFGMRIDPFLGTPALHAGIDYSVPVGYPARSTADGTVTMAGYDGGYGNMVEVDHGNGITTRYGHLSRVDVKVGQVVSKGTVLGRTGSTGRSTGPHLHYEVRVDGEAINPMRYIRAGSEIASLL